ncbi:transcriptional regulator CynR [Gordonia phthalatica]|uniref:Transcriptional regulator n=1 Tax=Gordonia phthalatica TaxID=1136941 RepID=A0A0N9N7H2_9ACTN|nr:transcriptional regulator CynR [Gordonia phthalatica]ALG83961.1 transcriptional regulator [Gordonia phthalatica]
MELRHIRYLLAVADHGNFTRAAESLHISQPTLSQQIKQFERHLGVELLDRSGRTVTLTDAGAAYAHHARLALRDLDAGSRAVHDVLDLSRGHVRVAMTPTFSAYLVGPLISRFRRDYPNITLALHETTQDRIEADLMADRIDVGIAFEHPHLPGIRAASLYTETLSLVAGPGHRLTGAASPTPVAALKDEPLTLLSSDFATRTHIDAHFVEHGATPVVAIEVNSISALLDVTRGSDLATVLPDLATDAHDDLTCLPLSPPLPDREVELLVRDGGYRSSAARAFTTALRSVVDELTAR